MSDYIKREDAYSACCYETLECYRARKEIKALPSADVAPVRHGRWEKNDNLFIDTLYRCSVCGEEFYLENGTPQENQYYYCPNCGAKMDGEEKNCDTCKHYDKWWDDIVCDGCTKAHSNWERRDDE